jgi:SulP family sulfate permease
VTAWNAARMWLEAPQWGTVLITGFVAGSMLLAARFRPGFPAALPAVALATIAVDALGRNVPLIGSIPSVLSTPSAPNVPWDHLSTLLVPALAVAALAALEGLLSATVADAMTVGERHDPNRELFGQGVANVVTPFFGGVPATAAIARTAVNVRSGSRSRLGAITQSLALLFVVLVATGWVSRIPLAALAGVLIATVVQMVEVSSIRALLRATRGDALVLAATAAATIAFDLVTAVVAGMVIAGLSALRQMALSVVVDETPIDAGDHTEEEQALLDEHVVAYRLDGPLFFGAAHRYLLEVAEISDVRVVILRLSRIRALDATGAAVLADTISTLETKGITVLLSGVQVEHDPVFSALGVYDELAHERHVFASTPEAIAHAREHVRRLAPVAA